MTSRMTAAIPTTFPVSSFIGVTVTSTRGGKADIGQPLLIDLDTNEDRHRVCVQALPPDQALPLRQAALAEAQFLYLRGNFYTCEKVAAVC